MLLTICIGKSVGGVDEAVDELAIAGAELTTALDETGILGIGEGVGTSAATVDQFMRGC
jgi:hypothetical protein